MDSLVVLRDEALRLYERYQKELIERFSICPWAKAARLAGRTRAHVVTSVGLDAEHLGPLVRDWSDDPNVDVGFLIAPRFEDTPDAFTRWSATIGDLVDGAFVAAAFHPDASSAAGVIHFLRQTPDPTVQLVRRSTLETIRSQDPPHYADIFELDLRELRADKPVRTVAASVLAHNTRLIAREGRERLQQIIDDIHQDRDQTYAKLIPRP